MSFEYSVFLRREVAEQSHETIAALFHSLEELYRGDLSPVPHHHHTTGNVTLSNFAEITTFNRALQDKMPSSANSEIAHATLEGFATVGRQATKIALLFSDRTGQLSEEHATVASIAADNALGFTPREFLPHVTIADIGDRQTAAELAALANQSIPRIDELTIDLNGIVTRYNTKNISVD